MRKTLFFMLVVSIYILSSCTGEYGTAKIKAEFSGMKNSTFIIEEIVPGRFLFVDSIRTNGRGKFSYSYKFKDVNPVFLRIFRNESDYITLLVSPNENIKLSSIINLATNYKVEGSEGSSLVRDLNLATLETYAKIEELSSIYMSTTIDEQKIAIEQQWNQLYIDQKRKNIDFLVRHPKSLATIIALYQSFPNGMYVFGDKNDFPYFTMISDSLSTVYPTSAHVKGLAKSVESRSSAINRLQNIVKYDQALPNIDLPDIYGINKNLNSIKDKVILLTFWSVSDPNSGMLNKELKELYGKMKDRGFEIYQVSLDKDGTQWISSIVEQNIPWISVRDQAGFHSVSARIYQISTIPSNYLISKDGVIEGKNLWGSDLTKKVEELTKQ